MTRFRGRWFDESSEEEPPLPSFTIPIPPLPFPEPVETPGRGRWLRPDEGDEPAPVQQGSHVKILPIPRWTGIAVGAGSIAFGVIALIALTGDMNVARGLLVLPVLGWIAYMIATRFAAADGQPAIVPILMGGLAVKFIGVLTRYWIGLQVYGRSDATEYARVGRLLAPDLRHFDFSNLGRLRGTNFLRVVTGVVFAITPASDMGGFFVFGFMSYIGMIFFWRAFKRAFPGVPDLRYLQVLMLLPSLAFWPSAIGKDTWMVMGVGIASYGVANILTNRTVIGWGSFVLGIYMVLAVRPQVGVALLVGLVVAELLRSRGSQAAGRAGLSLILLFVFGSVILSATASFLGVESWNKANVTQELDSVGGRTSEGRSEFTPTPVNSPVQFPLGAFTVLMRPMPYEVHSPQEFLSALENVAMLGFIIYSLPRLWLAIRRSRRHPYLLYCLGTIMTFVVEYSSFSNFALIARQRTQITALFLVFIAMPMAEEVVVKSGLQRSDPKPKRQP